MSENTKIITLSIHGEGLNLFVGADGYFTPVSEERSKALDHLLLVLDADAGDEVLSRRLADAYTAYMDIVDPTTACADCSGEGEHE